MKPVIKVLGFPEISEEGLREIHQNLVKIAVEDRLVMGAGGISLFFFPDNRSYGVGGDIVIEMTRLPLFYSKGGLHTLAKDFGTSVLKMFPAASSVEVSAESVSGYKIYWSSAD